MTSDSHDHPARHAGSLPALDARDWPVFQPGWVWMTGGGPGDPGLITLHALNALQQADVIIYDALVDPALLQWARPEADIEYAGKRGGKPSPSQRDISLRLIELARGNKRVLRLKGGDPFVFGRGGEEAQTLVQAGINIRVIPGISAGIGGLAYAGIPVTHRDVNQSVTFLSGHDRTGLTPSAIDWDGLGRSAQVIVMYMAIKHMPDICEKLIAAGRQADEPVAVVRNATREDMAVLETTLAKAPEDIVESGIGAPAIVCIGRVVLMRQCLDWLGQMAGEPVRDTDPLGVRAVSETG
ncbi:MAG: uroporphyrinogen-III C-methyltransferase [Pseudomonadota bacterium]|nr:uroporphyrinogen-III C-methyltransferase [Pseudomonadota bacterium]MEC7236521.1 uroporphyrinogen-III C-methyltransferase [Pseudomonadota bacterium]